MDLFAGESPKASDYITMGLAPAILGQLTAIASTMITPNAVEEVKPPPIQVLSSSCLHIRVFSGIQDECE